MNSFYKPLQYELTFEDKLEMLKNAVEIQGRKGNYSYNDYMLGYFNGLELALSILEDREPQFKESCKVEKNTRWESPEFNK